VSTRRLATAPHLAVTGGVVLALLGATLLIRSSADEVAVPALQTSANVSTTPFTGALAERQSGLLADEDHRLLTLVSSVRPGSAPYVEDLDDSRTLVLTAGGLAYGLPDLIKYGAAREEADGSVLVTEHVFVAPGARLTISAPGGTLHLASDTSGFVSLVAWKADLVLAGAQDRELTVSTWNADEQGPDTSVVDGRAYVREVSGDMDVRHVDASDLGFWAGRTSGVAWTGSNSTSATGSITDSSFRHNHYGAFASNGEDIEVTDSDFSDNAVDGLALHRSTAATTITDTTARNNGRHGFSADQGSESVTYDDVTAEDNTGSGIFFSGTPLSDGQSAGGASLRAYGQVHLTGGVLRSNREAGVRVVDGNNVSIADTQVADNTDGIVLVGVSAPSTIENTTVAGNPRFGISVSDGAATVQGNELSGSATAIRVRDAATAVTGNTVETATAHAISVVGDAEGSSISHNALGGRGPSALDVYRVNADVEVPMSANDLDGWTRDRDDADYWTTFIPNHPMLLLWVFVLGTPLLLTVRARRTPPQAPGSKPYRDDIRRTWARPLRVDLGQRVTAGQS